MEGGREGGTRLYNFSNYVKLLFMTHEKMHCFGLLKVCLFNIVLFLLRQKRRCLHMKKMPMTVQVKRVMLMMRNGLS